MKKEMVSQQELTEIIRLVEQILHLDDWCVECPSVEGRKRLKYMLEREAELCKDFDERKRLNAMILSGVRFIKQTDEYLALKKKHFQRQQNIKLLPLPPHSLHKPISSCAKQTIARKLEPRDCPALHTWPDGRQYANGHSGRLENAGQFMQRLLNNKLYDPSVYGELRFRDLRGINSKLYLALYQWQKRTGVNILDTKSTELAKLENKEKTDKSLLTFHEKHQLSNHHFRTRKKVASGH